MNRISLCSYPSSNLHFHYLLGASLWEAFLLLSSRTGCFPGSIINHWHLCPILPSLPFPRFHVFLFLLIDHTLQEHLNKEFREGKNFKAVDTIVLPLQDGQVQDSSGGHCYWVFWRRCSLDLIASRVTLIPTPILFSLESFRIFSVFSTPEFLSVDLWFISVEWKQFCFVLIYFVSCYIFRAWISGPAKAKASAAQPFLSTNLRGWRGPLPLPWGSGAVTASHTDV